MDVFIRAFGIIGQKDKQAGEDAIGDEAAGVDGAFEQAKETAPVAKLLQQFDLETEQKHAGQNEGAGEKFFAPFHQHQRERDPEQVYPLV